MPLHQVALRPLPDTKSRQLVFGTKTALEIMRWVGGMPPLGQGVFGRDHTGLPLRRWGIVAANAGAAEQPQVQISWCNRPFCLASCRAMTS